MNEPLYMVVLAGFALAALSIALLAGLKGWRGWLDLKRLELTESRQGRARSPTCDRIELADLKERIRKLESIAACVDL